jgi:hypothetical protein
MPVMASYASRKTCVVSSPRCSEFARPPPHLVDLVHWVSTMPSASSRTRGLGGRGARENDARRAIEAARRWQAWPMAPRALIAIALTLTALGLAPGAAHVMELPVKLGYSPDFYAQVTSTLYALYGVAGGTIQVAVALSVAALAWRLRRTPAKGLALASAAALCISLALWGSLVAPVNALWADVPRSTAEEFAAAYARLRPRWEFGHVAAFVAWLAGWFGLVTVAMRQPPSDAGGSVVLESASSG